MLRFEMEAGPVIMGFLTGAAIFLCQRLLMHRSDEEDQAPPKGKGEYDEDLAFDLQEPEPPRQTTQEPSPEPGCGPAPPPDVEEIPDCSSRAGWRRLLAFVAAAACAVLLLGLLAAAARPQALGLGGRASGREAPAPEVVERLPPAPRLAEGSRLEAVAPAERAASAAGGVGAAANAVEGKLEANAPEEDGQEAVFGAWAEDNFANDKVVVLNLTRQEMTLLEGAGSTLHVKSAYWSSITVGTPAETFRVVFDTGSGHLILPSAYCKSSTCRAHKRYRRTKSTSARDINYDGELVEKDDPRDQITVNFGTGEVTGVFVEEKVCLSHPGLPSALPRIGDGTSAGSGGCIPLRMIMATEMSEDPFKTFQFDGVLGLSLPGLSQTPEFNFIHVLQASLGMWGSTSPQVFAVFLAEHEHETSEISLGGYVSERLDGKVAWNRVIHPQLGHWMLRIKAIRVDGRTVDFCRKGCRAVVDTGTSLLAVPTPAFPEMYELLRHEADPSLACKGDGPRLRIELENFEVVLDPKDYAQPQSSLPGAKARKAAAPPRRPVLPPDFGRNESVAPEPEICKPMLMTMDLPAPVGPKLFVFGEPVLRKYYTVYDASETQPRIGFARALHADPADARAQEAGQPSLDGANVL